MSTSEDDDARAERIHYRAAALAKAKAAESRQAATLLREFAAQAQAAGIPTTVLKARAYSGDARYRTNITGWYLRRDHSVGVGLDGLFYVLSAPASIAARFSGVILQPSDAPMELGRGARDGESMPLDVVIARRLAAGADFR